MHRTTARFRKAFASLTVGRFWSVRVTDAVRALAVKEGADFVWVWIGTHDEYDRLVG